MRMIICIWMFLWPALAPAQDLIAYFNGQVADLSRYRLNKLTHVIYCFGHLKRDQMYLTHADSNSIRRLVDQKTAFPQLKVLLSLGGWEGCPTCPKVFSIEAGRRNFAHSVNNLLNYFHADGIDIDWEFPDNPDNFTALLQTLHDSLGPKKELSFAAAGFSPWLQRSYDWKKLVPLVNRVNLMTYDLIGSRSPITGHHAALYASPPQIESADHAVHYLGAMGVPPVKIVIGAAFYAREFDGVSPLNHGLFQPGVFRRFVAWNRLHKLPGFSQYWDSTARAAYSYNPTTKVFLSYDDERSLAAKARYTREHQLGGIMFWELRLDTRDGRLLDILYQGLHR
jgi:chitinase